MELAREEVGKQDHSTLTLLLTFLLPREKCLATEGTPTPRKKREGGRKVRREIQS